MKKMFILFFILTSFSNLSFTENRKPERMKQIYERIRNNLLENEKKAYLQNPHVIKIIAEIKNKNNITGEIRLPVESIKCVRKINSQNQETIQIKFNDIKAINFIKWQYKKLLTQGTYDKYIFTPSIIKIITKDGIEYYLKESSKLVTKLFIFVNDNDTVRLFADFVLYYDKVKKTFYNAGKNFNYFTQNPVINTLTGFSIQNYIFSGNNPTVSNNQRTVNRVNTPQSEIQMRESESAKYFEKQRLEREKREAQRRQPNQRQ